MEDTQNLSACIAKLQENVLQWEQHLQSEQSGPEAFGEVMDELRASLDDIGRAGFQHLAQACEIADETVVSEDRVIPIQASGQQGVDDPVGQGCDATTAVSA